LRGIKRGEKCIRIPKMHVFNFWAVLRITVPARARSLLCLQTMAALRFDAVAQERSDEAAGMTAACENRSGGHNRALTLEQEQLLQLVTTVLTATPSMTQQQISMAPWRLKAASPPVSTRCDRPFSATSRCVTRIATRCRWRSYRPVAVSLVHSLDAVCVPESNSPRMR
jgi:hypothetical protein